MHYISLGDGVAMLKGDIVHSLLFTFNNALSLPCFLNQRQEIEFQGICMYS
jgi:hypothetical protein